MSSETASSRRGATGAAFARYLWRHAGLVTCLLLVLPLLWFGIVYAGSLAALLAQSFFALDQFSGMILYAPTLSTWQQFLTEPANLDIVLRTLLMAACVTVACAVIAFPIAYLMARYAKGGWKALLYLLVMLPLWSSYLVKIYAWKLILAKEGAITWIFDRIGLSSVLDTILSLPIVGGPSLSVSYLGMFTVFTYLWLPFMILPIEAALQRVPLSLLEASGDLGARPRTTFARIVLPLAFPGIVAGSIFTFSLTMGDYILPYVIGSSRLFIGQVVYLQQGTAGNVPLAAAFSVVPIAVMALYLSLARRLGAFDAL